MLLAALMIFLFNDIINYNYYGSSACMCRFGTCELLCRHQSRISGKDYAVYKSYEILVVLLSSSDSSTAVQDIVAHTHGPTLFFTAGSAIQIWNLRMLVIAIGCSN